VPQKGSDSKEALRAVLRDYQRQYTGEGKDLDAAINAAYRKGARAGHQVFEVEHIFIRGDNPLSGYAVVLTPHGHG